MKDIVLDFRGIRSPLALHQYLKASLGLPEHYGHNMDALWDCLYCWYDEPVVLVLTHTEDIFKHIPQTAQTLTALLEELVRRDPAVSVRFA